MNVVLVVLARYPSSTSASRQTGATPAMMQEWLVNNNTKNEDTTILSV